MLLKKIDRWITADEDVDIADEINSMKSDVNDLQEADDNKDEDGNYVDIIHGEIYDDRTKQIFEVICDYGIDYYKLNAYYKVDDDTYITGIIDSTPFLPVIRYLQQEAFSVGSVL